VTKFVIPGVVFLLLAGVLYIGVLDSPNKSTMQSALLGKPVPVFDLPTLGNETARFTNAQLAGRPWVLNVWGTWCLACREEHATLLQIANQGAVPLIGLDWKDNDEDAKAWLQQLGNPYSVVAVDRDGRAAIEFGVYGAPETFLIDERGIVQYRHVGPMTADVWEREFLSRLPRKALP
jgi:cytochrome c biogenesis protein CcmG, thiol:disulfide interchange protein DsbE